MKLVKNSQGVKPLHHKGFKVRLRLVTRTLGLGLILGAALIDQREPVARQTLAVVGKRCRIGRWRLTSV